MANLSDGRKLLGIPQEYPHIVKVARGGYHGRIGDSIIATFPSGNSFEKNINKNWKEFQALAAFFYREQMVGWKHVAPLFPVVPVPGFAYLTLTTNPGGDAAPVDGLVGRIGVTEAWSTIVNGSGNDALADSVLAGGAYGSQLLGSAGAWNRIRRGIFGFDTSSLTAGITLTAGSNTLRFMGSGSAPDNAGSSSIVIDRCVPGNTAALASSDYNIANWAVVEQTTSRISFASWSTSAYNTFTLNSTGEGNVNKTGYSWFGQRNSHDFDVSEGGGSGGTNNGMNFIVDGSTNIQLIITYEVTPVGGVIPTLSLMGAG